jgi:hypothetical protein
VQLRYGTGLVRHDLLTWPPSNVPRPLSALLSVGMGGYEVESGRNWERIIGREDAGVNRGYWVRDRDEPDSRAYFKYVNQAQPDRSSLYSLAMERVAYRLGDSIGVPISETYLEELDGELGVLSLRVSGDAWGTIDDEVIRSLTFGDRDRWPVYMAFDVFFGNLDRRST